MTTDTGLIERAEIAIRTADGWRIERGDGGTSFLVSDLIRALLTELSRAPAGAEGWVLVPPTLTFENGAKHALIGEFYESYCRIGGDGDEHVEKVPVQWTTIKDIHKRVVELFAASPAPAQATPPAEARELVERVKATREKLVDYACHFGARDEVSKLFIAAALDHAEAVSVMLAALPAAPEVRG